MCGSRAGQNILYIPGEEGIPVSELAVQSLPVLTAEQARDLTARIRERVTDLLPLIREAFHRRADKAMGYETWQDYCDAELRGISLPVQERRDAAVELRQAGMSQRAISAALGVSQKTIDRDLDSQLSHDDSVEMPEQVMSLDGKQRPAMVPVVVSSAIRDAIDEHKEETAKRKADREELQALAEELGLKSDPEADARQAEATKLLYPFFDAVSTIAALPPAADVIGKIQPYQRYRLDDLAAAQARLAEFAEAWRAAA